MKTIILTEVTPGIAFTTGHAFLSLAGR